MAEIYLKSAENTLILSPREGVQRPFNFDAWTEVRIGMYLGGVTAAGDNTQAVVETVNISSYLDRITFGLKTNDALMPGQVGCKFIGVTSTTRSELSSLSMFGSADAVTGFYNGMNGAKSVDATFTTLTTPAVSGIRYPSDISGASSYCGFYALKFLVTDAGLSTQKIQVLFSQNNTVSGSNYSAAALLTDINNATYTSMGAAFDWNDGAAAYDLPDAFWLRMPFFNNRIRVSAIRAVRYA